MPYPDDPFEFVKRLTENYRQIRFGRGVVGKTGHATIGILLVWGIILWRLTENLWFDAALILGGLIATGVYGWWVKGTHKFAKENPGLALMEGAELLEYQRFEAQAKGLPSSPDAELTIAPHVSNQISGDPQQPDKT